MDAFVAFCDDGFYSKQQWSLRGGVTRRSGPIFLPGQRDQRNTLCPVAFCRVKDGHEIPAWLMRCPGALLLMSQVIAQANIGPGAARDHFVISSACTIGVEIPP